MIKIFIPILLYIKMWQINNAKDFEVIQNKIGKIKFIKNLDLNSAGIHISRYYNLPDNL